MMYGIKKDYRFSQLICIDHLLNITEYQAAIKIVQLARLEEQTNKRSENTEYLKSQLEKMPAIAPYKLYERNTGCLSLFPVQV